MLTNSRAAAKNWLWQMLLCLLVLFGIQVYIISPVILTILDPPFMAVSWLIFFLTVVTGELFLIIVDVCLAVVIIQNALSFFPKKKNIEKSFENPPEEKPQNWKRIAIHRIIFFVVLFIIVSCLLIPLPVYVFSFVSDSPHNVEAVTGFDMFHFMVLVFLGAPFVALSLTGLIFGITARVFLFPRGKLRGACIFIICTLCCLTAHGLDWVEVSADKTGFVQKTTGEPIRFWGVNYDRDAKMRLLDDYWLDEWDTVVEDFDEMQALGLNVVRIHLQVGRFLDSPTQPNVAALEQLAKLIRVADERGLYLYITGLACYRKANIPAWYDNLDENSRWAAQAVFWKHVARVCADSPAVFCYDLMNEPIVPGEPKDGWLTQEGLEDLFYVQYITRMPGDRPQRVIAKAWVETLAEAIRTEDKRHLITVGVIPWAMVWPTAKPLFYDPTVAEKLDFVSVHFYPEAGKIDAALDALKVYAIGKPLVIAEMFPLKCSIPELDRFIAGSRPIAHGWLSFYWGKTVAEYETLPEPTVGDAITGLWLEYVRANEPE